MSPRSETIRLYTNFLKLRYHFPNKQGRSALRRWTTLFFTLRQLEFEQIVRQHGLQQANEHAAQWRRQATHQYQLWLSLAEQDEKSRRQLLSSIIENTSH